MSSDIVTCPDCDARMIGTRVPFDDGATKGYFVDAPYYCPQGCPADGDLNTYAVRVDERNQ